MFADYRDYYDAVYGRDNKAADGEAHGWIQWKGTTVCIDLHCECGHHGHIDSEFFYTYQCRCGLVYAVGQVVKLIKLTKDELAYTKLHGTEIKCEDPEMIADE